MKINNGIRIYIHIPFCVRKCNYCDFLSFAGLKDCYGPYCDALIREIKAYGNALDHCSVSSIFIGGGTPSVLEAKDLCAVLETVFESFSVNKDAEITTESNPGTLDISKLMAYANAGINRLSIGLQSADDKILGHLGRIHSYKEFIENYKNAIDAGFENINIDIMSGLPGQTIQGFKDTLDKVVSLKPKHISAYSLIIEEGTPFYKMYGDGCLKDNSYPSLPAEEDEREIYHLTKEILGENGYKRYEISNYALEGYECRHNTGYWVRDDYLGFGLGASSLYKELRWKNTADFSQYLEADYIKAADTILKETLSEPFEEKDVLPLCEMSRLSKEDSMSETMFLGLRLCRGVNLKEFIDIYDVDPASLYGDHIRRMKSENLLTEENGYLRLTEKGTDLANYVMQGFV